MNQPLINVNLRWILNTFSVGSGQMSFRLFLFEHFDHDFLLNFRDFIDFFNHSVKDVDDDIGEVGYCSGKVKRTIIQSSHEISLKKRHEFLRILLCTLFCCYDQFLTKIIAYLVNGNHFNPIRDERNDVVVEFIE